MHINEELEATRQLGTGLDMGGVDAGKEECKVEEQLNLPEGAEAGWCDSHPVPCKMARIKKKKPDHGLDIQGGENEREL